MRAAGFPLVASRVSEVYAVPGERPAVMKRPFDLAAVNSKPIEKHLHVYVIA